MAEILTLLAVSVLLVGVFRRLKLPPLLGYLFVGIVLGPHALGWFDNQDAAHLLGEIGVAFLLFTIGLHFSISQFLAMRKILLGLGGAQVLVGSVSGAAIAWWLGVSWEAAVIVGGALAMSSTAIVIKQLTDQFELQAPHGHMSLGILLFQDLAAVPFLVAIPILATDAGDGLAVALLYAVIKGALALTVMLAAGRLVLQRLFDEVATAGSMELFTLTVLLVSLLAAWLTSLLGLSLALGAFLAGMMLSETEYRHQIDTELRPFKDILLGLFFISIGMALDTTVLPALWLWIALLVAGLIIGKGGIIALLTWWFSRNPRVAVRTGLVLGHGGEFGLALLALSFSTGLLGRESSQPILAAIVITMLAAPLLIRCNEMIANRLLPGERQPVGELDGMPDALPNAGQHVVICGFGRVGGQMAGLLRAENIPYVALDLLPEQVKRGLRAGDQVFYGDAGNREILKAAGLESASALVISFNDDAVASRIVHSARSLRRDIPILVRSQDDSNLESLLAAGATEVIPETLETSLMLTTNLMLLLNTPRARIDDLVQSMRRNRYTLLDGDQP
ncbi:MAG: cation:proton antiporter [Gammaproteobacteria bacterium]|nr:cation:proton antiporter [Gammaproteobacteria bacterium]